MVFSELLLKIPYSLSAIYKNWILKNKAVYFYADSLHDYIVFKNVHKYLPSIKIVAKNTEVHRELLSIGIRSDVYPVVPKVIIMARHSLHKFPSGSIISIGMRHGPYHFKNFIDAKKYNKFNLFLLTSPNEVEQGKAIGIKKAVSGGYPKLDDLFIDHNLKHNEKKVILFSATWDKSGLSAIDKWFDKLTDINDKYNILVTVHPKTSKHYIEKLKSTPGVLLLNSANLTDYMQIADILVCDTSSIIAEFNALDKPIITFKIPTQGRLSDEINNMLDDMTYRINNYSELKNTIEKVLADPNKLQEKRQKYNKIMFHQPLGNHGLLAANVIKEYLSEKGIEL